MFRAFFVILHAILGILCSDVKNAANIILKIQK